MKSIWNWNLKSLKVVQKKWEIMMTTFQNRETYGEKKKLIWNISVKRIFSSYHLEINPDLLWRREKKTTKFHLKFTQVFSLIQVQAHNHNFEHLFQSWVCVGLWNIRSSKKLAPNLVVIALSLSVCTSCS